MYPTLSLLWADASRMFTPVAATAAAAAAIIIFRMSISAFFDGRFEFPAARGARLRALRSPSTVGHKHQTERCRGGGPGSTARTRDHDQYHDGGEIRQRR